MAANEDGSRLKLDPNAPIALQAQNPPALGDVRVGSASEEAAGIPAIWNTMLYGIGDMGPASADFGRMTSRWPQSRLRAPMQDTTKLRLDADAVVDGSADSLLAPKVSFGRLDRDVSRKELNLLQFATAD